MQKAIFNEAYRKMVGQLRSKRKAMGLSQREVARKLSVHRSWLTHVEMCEVRMDVVQYVRVCRVYGLSASRMMRQLEGASSSEEDDPLYLLNQSSRIVVIIEQISTARLRLSSRVPVLQFQGLLFYSLVEFRPMGRSRCGDLN